MTDGPEEVPVYGVYGEDKAFYRSLYRVEAGSDDEVVRFPSGLVTTWGRLRRKDEPRGVLFYAWKEGE